MLDCGTRAFDFRPHINNVTGEVQMHHGPVVIAHAMEAAVAEAIEWAAGKPDPSDLVLFMVTDCQGDECWEKAKTVLAKLNISCVVVRRGGTDGAVV